MYVRRESPSEELDRLQARARELARQFKRRYAVYHNAAGTRCTVAERVPLDGTIMFLTTDDDEATIQ